ncbi:MAG: nucleoside-diphosphate sugar epimerase/dehydratase [Blastocatellia bacterium]
MWTLGQENNPGASRHWPRVVLRQQQFAVDFAILTTAFLLAYLLRFDFAIPTSEWQNGIVQWPIVVLTQLALLAGWGVYAFVWRYVGMGEMKTFVLATLSAAAPFFALRLLLPPSFMVLRVPLSITVIDTMLAFGGVVGARVLRRALYERRKKQRAEVNTQTSSKRPILLIGAGRAGLMAAREIQNNGALDLDVRGFVDDEPMKQGSVIQGVRVLGTVADLPRLVQEQGIDHVVISIAQATRAEFRRIMDICESIPIKVRTIPALYELLQGHLEVTRIRNVQIEDLLGRPPINLDEERMQSFLVNRVVMVTGAGGSIGSELARQVARCQPSQLLLVERSEFALFTIERELRELHPQLTLKPLIVDVGDEAGLRSIFTTYRPAVVVHAAAHKHVPMMEQNPCEAVKNNVLATHLLGMLSGEHSVETFVLISTDKAVRPTSVMGASKRVAELIMQHLNKRFRTRYVAVRFGNVIGSAGSVIPIFREQICKGGPVKVTHPEMMRYFMTIPEAAQLVLQAGAMGEGGEIFILDMGEPVRILDLAKDTITLSGLKPYEDIDIVFTGVRPGEKLFEELQTTDETVAKTRHPKIFIGKINGCADEVVRRSLQRFAYFARIGAVGDIRQAFNELLPEARLQQLPAVITLNEEGAAAPAKAFHHVAVGGQPPLR